MSLYSLYFELEGYFSENTMHEMSINNKTHFFLSYCYAV